MHGCECSKSTTKKGTQKNGFNPDAVLIVSEPNKSIPDDAPIQGKKVGWLYCSKGDIGGITPSGRPAFLPVSSAG